ncbi:MAG TPA: ferritin family protein [Thermodesulfovibrionales bacterium]|nr:ferritin family protein [Thermodesulfovibrionales bacterium]
MDIYEFALKMEKDGENYYRELAVGANNKGLRNILTMLADAEVIHYNLFKKMKDREKVEPADSAILDDTKNVFMKMKEEKDVTGLNIQQTELYEKALEIEKKSEDFYRAKAAETKDEIQKKVFMKIAGQEKIHYFIVERILDFVSRPQTWLENPEWYHLEEY